MPCSTSWPSKRRRKQHIQLNVHYMHEHESTFHTNDEKNTLTSALMSKFAMGHDNDKINP
jgi:hypothetical protein